jgi:hypothetical protein
MVSKVPNYMERNGDKWVIGGEVEVDGHIEIDGTAKVDGTLEVDGRLQVDGHMDRAGAVVLPSNVLKSAIVQHYSFAPAAVSAVAVLAATALTADAQAITAGITNPDFPRTVTAKGNAAGIVGNVVITGTNIKDEVITDTIALNGAAEVEGVKAFKTVTQVDLPVEVNAGTDTVSIGIGKKFGLPHIVLAPGCLFVKLFDLAVDAGTLAVDVDEIEKNLFTLAGDPNGAKFVDLFYLV